MYIHVLSHNHVKMENKNTCNWLSSISTLLKSCLYVLYSNTNNGIGVVKVTPNMNLNANEKSKCLKT